MKTTILVLIDACVIISLLTSLVRIAGNLGILSNLIGRER